MSPLELQQSIERFTGRFADAITLAVHALRRAESVHQQRFLRRALLFASSAIDIAAGPHPKTNLVDMLVFITLSRRTLECCWYSDGTKHMLAALVELLAECEAELWKTADLVIDDPQQWQILELLQAWNASSTQYSGIRSV